MTIYWGAHAHGRRHVAPPQHVDYITSLKICPGSSAFVPGSMDREELGSVGPLEDYVEHMEIGKIRNPETYGP